MTIPQCSRGGARWRWVLGAIDALVVRDVGGTACRLRPKAKPTRGRDQ
jgi:hypothetical protein